MNAADVGTSGISVILSQNETSGSDTPLTPGYSSSFLSTGDYLFHTINSLTPASEYTFKAVASYQSIPSDPSYVSACTYPKPVTACSLVQLDKSTHELDCTPPTDPAGFVSHGYTVTSNNGQATNVTLPVNLTSLTPAALYTYKVETNYECSLTGSTLQSSQFLLSAYTIPDSPLFTTITPSTDTLEFTLDRNNDNVPPSLSSLHMQFWKGSCDAQCVFPFVDAAVSATEVFYECQPYATGPNTTEFKCASSVIDGTLQQDGLITCPSSCLKTCSGSTTGYKCNFPAVIDNRQFHTCTGYDSTSSNTLTDLTSVSASGTCQVTNLTNSTLVEDFCDASTHCAATEVSSNVWKNNLEAGTQYFARLYYLYRGMVSAGTMGAACTKPNLPENVEAGSETTDIFLNVVWSAPTSGNCDGYRFVSSDLGITDQNVTSSSRSYNISSGVIGETCYRVEMACYVWCSDVNGAKSELVGSYVASDLCSLPGQPTLTVSARSNSSIFVGIQGQFPIQYEEYELQYSTNDSVFTNVTGATAVSASNDVGAILGGSGLDSATEYFFRARVKRNGVWSIYSIVSSTCTFPNKPDNFIVSTCDKSSVTMSWNSVSGASGYFVRVGESDVFANTTSNTSYTISSLSEGQAYTLEIMSYVVCPSSGDVINSTVVSASQFTAPKTPTITVTNAASTPKQITVILNNYNPNLIASVFRDGSQVIGNIVSGSVVDTVPDAGKLYAYTARYSLAEAAPACENSAVSNVFEICSYPGLVTNLDYDVTNSSWTMLHWTAPTGSVTGYRWYIEGNAATDVFADVNVNITDLTPSQTYFLNVVAYLNCSDGNQLEGAPAGILVQTMPRSVDLTTLPVSDSEIQIVVATNDAVTNITLFRDGTLINSNMRSGDSFTDTGRSPGKT
ncbi:uncharacterized protein LOC142357630 [Convolutriloba macropyga]|uniref:uncharacterized protein LOC142357630 n=1 Tax=Convolutriloba macropyga TaxID=536237 RepID=UPI003F52108C